MICTTSFVFICEKLSIDERNQFSTFLLGNFNIIIFKSGDLAGHVRTGIACFEMHNLKKKSLKIATLSRIVLLYYEILTFNSNELHDL